MYDARPTLRARLRGLLKITEIFNPLALFVLGFSHFEHSLSKGKGLGAELIF